MANQDFNFVDLRGVAGGRWPMNLLAKTKNSRQYLQTAGGGHSQTEREETLKASQENRARQAWCFKILAVRVQYESTKTQKAAGARI